MGRESTIAGEIAERGWTVAHDFLPAETVGALAREAESWWKGGAFAPAGVGKGSRYRVRPEVRGDYIAWLDEGALSAAQAIYWKAVDDLRATLNRQLFAGLREFEAHLAVYPAGAFYAKHLDRFAASGERVISCTLYLNHAWRAADGGALRLYPPPAESEIFHDILPRAGTFVAFRSDTIYHEVLPASRPRFSLTGWLRRETGLLPTQTFSPDEG